MGRSRSRRSRGKSGGQGSGGSGKGKGKGGSRGRSSNNRGGQGKGGSGSGKGTGGSRGRSSNTRGGQSKANRNQNKKARRTVKSIANSRVGKAIGKSLSTAGKVTRQLRQPMSGLASLGIRSVLNNPAVARSIAQYGANTFGAQNQRTRDMSKLSPQQQRKYQRLSEKTGRDYSVRNPTFRLNMNMKDIAKFAGLDRSGLYNRLPSSIRNAQINKQFYGNPMKKGWHSSQRTGRGQGLRAMPIDTEQIPQQFGRAIRGIPKERMGPQQDWLSQLYSSHNISGGKLDQEARDYWSGEAKTKGRDAVMRSIIGTSKAQGTYGGRKRPRRITTGPRRRGGGPIASAINAGMGLIGGGLRAKSAKRKQDLQNEGAKRRMAKSLAAHMAARGM
jgi:hypothetical protein